MNGIKEGEIVETLRDRFAMAALQGLLADGAHRQAEAEVISEKSYLLADAMIVQKTKQEVVTPQ